MTTRKELRQFAKDNDRRLVSMTCYSRAGTKCDFEGSVDLKDVDEIVKMWTRLVKLSGKNVPTK